MPWFLISLLISAAVSARVLAWLLDGLGALIWPSYPGRPYAIYLGLVFVLGLVLLRAMIVSARRRALGVGSGIRIGVAAGFALAPFVLAWDISHV
jgi:ABC-type microcin C transport system permease subunit YejB